MLLGRSYALSIGVKWHKWASLLSEFNDFRVSRSYFNASTGDASCIEFHVFRDASELAVSTVAYLVCHTNNNEVQVGFVLGKSKVSPKQGHTFSHALSSAVRCWQVKLPGLLLISCR